MILLTMRNVYANNCSICNVQSDPSDVGIVQYCQSGRELMFFFYSPPSCLKLSEIVLHYLDSPA